MKKKFVEPELVRIYLKTTENIAASGEVYTRLQHPNLGVFFAAKQYEIGCVALVANTIYPPAYFDDIANLTPSIEILLGDVCYYRDFDCK